MVSVPQSLAGHSPCCFYVARLTGPMASERRVVHLELRLQPAARIGPDRPHQLLVIYKHWLRTATSASEATAVILKARAQARAERIALPPRLFLQLL